MKAPRRYYGCLIIATIILGGASGCRPQTAAPAGPAEPAEAEKPPVAVTVVTAIRKDVGETVPAQGTLAVVQGGSARVAAPFAGRLLRVSVREGDAVRAGQEVAALDTRTQAAQARSAEAGYQASLSQAEQARLSASAARTDQEGAVRLASLGLDSARVERTQAVQAAQTMLELAANDLIRIQAGPRPQEVVQAQDAVKQAEATRARAETEVTRQRFLFEKGVSARRQVDDAETALSLSDSAIESARQNLELVQAGARPEERAAAELRVRQAREQLKQAQATGDARVAQAQATLRQAEQGKTATAAKAQEARAATDNVRKSAADLSSARLSTDYGVLRSPLTGVVVRRNLQPGDMADPATPVLEIADLRTLDLLANLPSDAGARVRPGMSARLTLPGKESAETPEAKVISVGQVDPQTNLLTVRLRVPNADGRLKVGQFVTASILVRESPRAVVVPKEAVLTRDGKQVVFVLEGEDTAKQREVQVGAEQDGMVEILRGLAVGAKVIRLGQYELTDDAKVKVATE